MVRHSVAIYDRRLAKIVRRCRDLPGDELFQDLAEDGTRHAIDSADVNAYLRASAGDDFTTKDFRTFGGTVIAAHALAECGLSSSTTAGTVWSACCAAACGAQGRRVGAQATRAPTELRVGLTPRTSYERLGSAILARALSRMSASEQARARPLVLPRSPAHECRNTQQAAQF